MRVSEAKDYFNSYTFFNTPTNHLDRFDSTFGSFLSSVIRFTFSQLSGLLILNVAHWLCIMFFFLFFIFYSRSKKRALSSSLRALRRAAYAMLTQNANNYQLIRIIPSTTESASKNSIHHHFKQNLTIYWSPDLFFFAMHISDSQVTSNPFLIIVSGSPPFLGFIPFGKGLHAFGFMLLRFSESCYGHTT
jgi:hypothetical protein